MCCMFYCSASGFNRGKGRGQGHRQGFVSGPGDALQDWDYGALCRVRKTWMHTQQTRPLPPTPLSHNVSAAPPQILGDRLPVREPAPRLRPRPLCCPHPHQAAAARSMRRRRPHVQPHHYHFCLCRAQPRWPPRTVQMLRRRTGPPRHRWATPEGRPLQSPTLRRCWVSSHRS